LKETLVIKIMQIPMWIQKQSWVKGLSTNIKVERY